MTYDGVLDILHMGRGGYEGFNLGYGAVYNHEVLLSCYIAHGARSIPYSLNFCWRNLLPLDKAREKPPSARTPTKFLTTPQTPFSEGPPPPHPLHIIGPPHLPSNSLQQCLNS